MPRLGAFLRGTTSPVGLALACLLGGAIGLTPWPRGALLAGALALVALAGNLNLVVATAAGLASHLLSPALEPAAFAVGRWVLDGPLGALIAVPINTPGPGLLGLDTYGVTGGLLMGGSFGLVLFTGLAPAAATFQRRLRGLADGSELLRRFKARPQSRLIAALMLVEGHRADWKAALLPAGRPVRLSRAAIAAALAAGCLALARTPPARGMIARAALARIAPHLTVERTVWEPGSDVVRFVGITQIRRGESLSYAVSAAEIRAEGVRLDLMRGRVEVSQVAVLGAEVRALPDGVPPPEPTFLPGELPAASVWKDPALWSATTACLSDCLAVLGRTRPGTPEDADSPGSRRESASSGRRDLEARHLLRGRARVSVGQVLAENARLPNGTACTLRASTVSTHPWLEATPASLDAAGPRVELSVVFPAGEAGRLTLSADALETDAVIAALRIPPDPRPTGGTLSLRMAAPVALNPRPGIHAAPVVSFQEPSLVLGGGAPLRAPDFSVRLGANGPIAALAVSLAPDEVSRALADAGASGLAAAVRAAREQPEPDDGP